MTGVNIDHPAPLTSDDVPDADIIIGTWWQTMQWIEKFPKEKGAKIHLIQDYEIWLPNDPEKVNDVLRYDCTKIAISSFLCNLLQNEFGNKDVHYLPNAVDHTFFFSPSREKGSVPTVGFCYSPDMRKGSDLIIKAVTRARAEFPELKVLAFGHYTPQQSIPVPEWIDFHVDPPQEDIRSLYTSCDAWLFGSRREGFGLPILEAMACRTPVIGMPAGAAPELLADGAGILIVNQEWESMAKAIVDIAEMSGAEWLALSQRAHKRALENSWDIIGERLEKILNELVMKK